MDVRTLRPDEREACLDLLDGWDVGDAWRGADFFRRYLEHEAGFSEENVQVAVESGRLVACVQTFPRRLRVGSGAVATGGIGSVYTHPDWRRRGLAEALLARAVASMRSRGMPLSLLFAARLHWYAKLGWRSMGLQRTILARPEGPGRAPTPALELRPFRAEADLEEVAELHASFDTTRPGSALRDLPGWRASLSVGGNPAEEFQLARSGAGLRAYARAIVLEGAFLLSEFAHAPGAEAELVELVAGLAAPRDPDPLAEAVGARGDLRSRTICVDLGEQPELAAAFSARGFQLARVADPTPMLRCLDAPALAAAAGSRLAPGESSEALLARLFPAERFGFWPSDRF